MYRSFLLSVSCACLAAAQGLPALLKQAPPDVDSALRSRVTKFYALQKESKFRAAEDLVCEDGRDIYYASDKVPPLSYEIMKIDYESGFRNAVVLGSMDRVVVTRAGSLQMKVPVPSRWKQAAGTWCVDLNRPLSNEIMNNPMSTAQRSDVERDMKAAASRETAVGAAKNSPPGKPVAIADIQAGVVVDPPALNLRVDAAATFEVKIINKLGGSIQLSLTRNSMISGLTFDLQRTNLNRGETAILRVNYKPGSQPTRMRATTAEVKVEPLGATYVIPILFDAPGAPASR